MQPDHDPQLYWSVAGAETIKGKPAESWAEGSLRVDEYPGLEIAWQDSIQGGRLALHTKVLIKGQDGETETQERFFLWVLDNRLVPKLRKTKERVMLNAVKHLYRTVG